MKKSLVRIFAVLILILGIGIGISFLNANLRPDIASSYNRINTPTLPLASSPQVSTEISKLDTPKAIPTITPAPTFTSKEVEQFIVNAKQTNLGCQIPCWWGIFPGETSWNTTSNLFRKLTSRIEKLGQRKGYRVELRGTGKQEILGLYFYLTDNEIVEAMDVPSFYTVDELISQFGTPEQVWFYSGGVSAYSLPPSVSLALFYPKNGLLFYYQDGTGEYLGQGDMSIKVCREHFSNSISPRLYLWNSFETKTFEQIKTYLFIVPEDWRFRPLEDVTNIDIPTFTKAFSSPDSPACFLSPSDIWPYPLP